MKALSTALLVGAMAVAPAAFSADQVKTPPQTTSKDCSKLSGTDKDKCIQATPAGPADMQTGKQHKGGSNMAKERERSKQDDQANNVAPRQSNDTVGHPEDRKATGEAQTGAKTSNDNSPSAKTAPQQSKDTIGKPGERRGTGEAQTGQAPSQSNTRTQ